METVRQFIEERVGNDPTGTRKEDRMAKYGIRRIAKLYASSPWGRGGRKRSEWLGCDGRVYVFDSPEEAQWYADAIELPELAHDEYAVSYVARKLPDDEAAYPAQLPETWVARRRAWLEEIEAREAR